MKLSKVIKFLQHAEKMGQTELIFVSARGDYYEIELALSANLGVYATRRLSTRKERQLIEREAQKIVDDATEAAKNG